ncbi:alcohol dehydrogenase catalytic domain-containing protein [Bacillus niameyensis]|uniref:alcohol dehydrogenase catalytic domain-containing protein n=1 Tax=Bacillus niameyensis TaxID=1522308 RepID=UPI0008410094|nr:alcohol dehydrogenase catalytic domain-containing protein [Bacillus niameyensis]
MEKNTNTMIQSKAFRLVKPGEFVESVIQHELKSGEVVVMTTLASICHADLRYYTGQRRKEALKEKLPMALFHEGIGKITRSNDKSISVGQNVVIVPTIPGRLRFLQSTTNRVVDDNYSKDGAFLGSGYDGIAQSQLIMPAENVIPIPEDVPDRIALLAELNSVSLHALEYVSGSLDQGKVAVFGDGPVGFLTAAILSHMYKIPKNQLLVFGAIPDKLTQFDFATTYLVHDFNFKDYEGVVTVVECTGGRFSESAINQAIELIEPQGKIVLMGVSEDRVPINTRDILEKGITLFGSSRSTAKDFAMLMDAFRNKDYQLSLKKLLPEHDDVVRNVEDLKNVMDKTAEHKGWKKTVIAFEW